ncbi:hypothetical protein THUN1379_29250 [Paludibacterium sp. THUN1379]|uniref:DUF2799 domain-containing protein n=1 Tax=Paludibacterium sp. THUN1379 TaxID=3112107 RepID=UPI0030860C3B|nr:hypothetical protein THUN1379_29250 [Paludibacterium sp. THUN1379]
MKILTALLCLLPLAGCATMNEQECRNITPAQLGLKDGRQGYGLWRLEKHVESCARFGIDFDRQAYLTARETGLQGYCTPENGEKVGERGEGYEGVCPASSEPAFLAKYQPAYREYLIDNRGGPFWFPWPLRH